MNYINYLTTHLYDELPANIRAEIDREDYGQQREVALAVGPEETGLPLVLAAAFQQATEAKVGPRPPVQKQVVKSGGGRTWLLAAGWLLFAVAAITLLLRQPATRIVYQTAAAAPAEVIIRYDTVFVPQVETIVRYRTVRDTIVLEIPVVEYFAVTDTLYVPMPLGNSRPTTVSGSRSLADREGVTRFLFGTE